MPEKSITEHLDRIAQVFAEWTASAEDTSEWDAIRQGRESLTSLRASIAEMERSQKAAEIVLCGYFEHRKAHDLEIVGAESARAVIAGFRAQIEALIIERDQARAAVKAYMFVEQTRGGLNPHAPGTNRYRAFELGRAALSSTTPTQPGSPANPTPSVEAEANRESSAVERLLNVARGCHDYAGGYRGITEPEVYHHGIQTVINALEAAVKNPGALQVRVLEGIGATLPTPPTPKEDTDANKGLPELTAQDLSEVWGGGSEGEQEPL